MKRVLHLLDRDGEFESERISSALCTGLSSQFEIIRQTIGFGGTYRSTAMAAAALLRGKGKAFDLIHAFSPAALGAAAMGANRPIIFTPGAAIRPATVRWLRAVNSYRRVETVCSTATARRILIERGIVSERCQLVRPAVDLSKIRKRRDPALRTALGFLDSDRVILAVGESTRPAAHSDAAWAAGILHVADPKYKLLLWGRGPLARQVRDLACRWNLPKAITLAQEKLGRPLEFEELLPASDIIVVTARGPIATLPIAIAMASGLPIVSTVTYTVSELLEDRHTALVAPAHQPRLLARRIMDLEEDPSVQWSISDMARTEAFEYFSLTRAVSQYREIYEQVLESKTVRVTEPATQVGLRFHGRA